MGVGVHHVVARAVVERQGRRELPFVLQIETVKLTGLAPPIGDGERDIAGLGWRAVWIRRKAAIDRQDRRGNVRAGVLVLEERTKAQRVIAPEPLAGVRLNPGSEARQFGGVSEAVENDVAEVRIRGESRLRIADKRRDLEIECVAGILV